MELDVAAAGSAIAQRTRRHVVAIREPNPKPIDNSGLAVVLHPDAETNGLGLVGVGPGGPADIARGRRRHVHGKD